MQQAATLLSQHGRPLPAAQAGLRQQQTMRLHHSKCPAQRDSSTAVVLTRRQCGQLLAAQGLAGAVRPSNQTHV